MRKALSSVKPAWKELAYTRAARVPRARRARRWVRPPSGGQSPVAAAPDACAAAGTARRALRRPCVLIEVSPPERLPSASRAGKPRLALANQAFSTPPACVGPASSSVPFASWGGAACRYEDGCPDRATHHVRRARPLGAVDRSTARPAIRTISAACSRLSSAWPLPLRGPLLAVQDEDGIGPARAERREEPRHEEPVVPFIRDVEEGAEIDRRHVPLLHVRLDGHGGRP